jgi:hypothetical protein
LRAFGEGQIKRLVRDLNEWQESVLVPRPLFLTPVMNPQGDVLGDGPFVVFESVRLDAGGKLSLSSNVL